MVPFVRYVAAFDRSVTLLPHPFVFSSLFIPTPPSVLFLVDEHTPLSASYHPSILLLTFLFLAIHPLLYYFRTAFLVFDLVHRGWPRILRIRLWISMQIHISSFLLVKLINRAIVLVQNCGF